MVYINKMTSEVSYTLIDAALAIIVKMCRINLGDQLNPVDVHLSHSPPSCIDGYEQYYKSTIHFDSSENVL